MALIEDPGRVLRQLEAIDIQNDEYVFWDANGRGVTITVTVTAFTNKLNEIRSSAPAFPLQDAFLSYAKSLGLAGPLPEGLPIDVWRHIQSNLAPGKS